MARPWHPRFTRGPYQRRAGFVLARARVIGEPVSLRYRLLFRARRIDNRPAAHNSRGGGLMYVAVKGGERAIERSWDLLAANRRGDEAIAELSVDQIREQLGLAVARVMTEGSVYDEELAALAIKQAAGDLVEAIFLLRAYRTTLPRFGYTVPLDTENMLAERRISAAFKDIPGGQMLGGTYDYTQRLLDF